MCHILRPPPYNGVAGDGQSKREGRRFHGYRSGPFPPVPAGAAAENFWNEMTKEDKGDISLWALSYSVTNPE